MGPAFEAAETAAPQPKPNKYAIATLKTVAPPHVSNAALASCLATRDPATMKATIKGWWRTAEKRKQEWWKSLPASETDPISLEPLKKLRKAPFVLKENGHDYRFDGRVLAAYLVSSNVFENPLTRRPLTPANCEALDAHLVTHALGEARVARALELAGDEDAARARERDALRAESAAIMSSLFGASARRGDGGGETLGARHRRLQDGSARAAVAGGGGFVVRDEDATAFSTTDAAASAAARRAPPPAPDAGDAEAYPSLAAPQRAAAATTDAFWARRAAAPPRSATLFAAPAAPAPSRAAATTTSLSRNRRLAATFGVAPERAEATVTYPDALLDWARRTAAGEALGLDGGLSALQALERKLARACDLPRLDVALPPRAAARDRDRAADLAAFYGLAAEPYGAGMDGAGPYYLRCRRSTNSAPPAPPLSAAAARRGAPPEPPRPAIPPRRPRAEPEQWPGLTADAEAGWERPRDAAAAPPAEPEPRPPLAEAAPSSWELLLLDDDDDDDDDAPRAPAAPTAVLVPLTRASPPPLARDDGDVCAICLEALGDAIDCTVMPCCRVEIHAHCLASWCEAAAVHTAAAGRLTSAASCPNCRQDVPVFSAPLPVGKQPGR